MVNLADRAVAVHAIAQVANAALAAGEAAVSSVVEWL